MSNQHARHLRKNLTEAERRLWYHLRKRNLDNCKFRRQVPLGKYIVDFACLERRLIIELDGGPHTLHREKDDQRTRWLESQDFRVIRFWNHEVYEDLEPVLEAIWNALKVRSVTHASKPPTPTLPREGGGG
ncbi:MAG: endonuclease domain-containing protein [Planctomycetaceae bacterium]